MATDPLLRLSILMPISKFTEKPVVPASRDMLWSEDFGSPDSGEVAQRIVILLVSSAALKMNGLVTVTE